MNEQIPEKPEEKEPVFRLFAAGQPYELRRDNCAIFTFLGHAASRNHIYWQKPELQEEENESENYRGLYFFAIDTVILRQMVDKGYIAHFNLPEVPECDERAYQKYCQQKAEYEASRLGDFIPEDWEK